MSEKPLIDAAQEQILSLSDETQFAPNGIVSRTLLRTANTRVVLFGFTEGQELTEHRSTQSAISRRNFFPHARQIPSAKTAHRQRQNRYRVVTRKIERAAAPQFGGMTYILPSVSGCTSRLARVGKLKFFNLLGHLRGRHLGLPVVGKLSKDDDEKNNPDNAQRHDDWFDAAPGESDFDAESVCYRT